MNPYGMRELIWSATGFWIGVVTVDLILNILDYKLGVVLSTENEGYIILGVSVALSLGALIASWIYDKHLKKEKPHMSKSDIIKRFWCETAILLLINFIGTTIFAMLYYINSSA